MLRQHVKFSVKMILRQRIKPYTDSKTIIQEMKKECTLLKVQNLKKYITILCFQIEKEKFQMRNIEKNIFTIQ